MSILGGLIGGAGNIVSSIFQKKNIDKQISAQREENQLNREWNLNLAKMQNQWNIEQWQRENEYNSPTAVASRLEAAGLNKDMMYGSGVSGLGSASSPSLTAGASSTPTDVSAYGNMPTYGDVLSASVDGYLKTAQAKNIEADTKKKETESDKNVVETDILSTDALFRAAEKEQSLKVGDVQIALNKSYTELSKKQQDKIVSEIKVMDEQYNKMRADVKVANEQVKLLRENQITARFERALKSKEFSLAVKEVRAKCSAMYGSASLSEQQARDLIVTQAARLGLLGAQTYNAKQSGRLNSQSANLVDIHADHMQLRYLSDSVYLNDERETSISTSWMNAISNAVGTLTGLMKVKSK